MTDIDLPLIFEGKKLQGRLLGQTRLDPSGDAMIAIKEVFDTDTGEKVWVTKEMMAAFKARYIAVLNEQLYSKAV